MLSINVNALIDSEGHVIPEVYVYMRPDGGQASYDICNNPMNCPRAMISKAPENHAINILLPGSLMIIAALLIWHKTRMGYGGGGTQWIKP